MKAGGDSGGGNLVRVVCGDGQAGSSLSYPQSSCRLYPLCGGSAGRHMLCAVIPALVCP